MQKRVKVTNESTNGGGPNWSAKIDRSIKIGNESFGLRIDFGTKSLYMHERRAHDCEMDRYKADTGKDPQNLRSVTIREYYGIGSDFLEMAAIADGLKQVFISVPDGGNMSATLEDTVNEIYNNTFLKRMLLRNGEE